MKTWITDYLMDELMCPYCNNCKFQNVSEKESVEVYGYYGCEDCHRKNIGWELSKEEAERIATNIIRIAKKEA